MNIFAVETKFQQLENTHSQFLSRSKSFYSTKVHWPTISLELRPSSKYSTRTRYSNKPFSSFDLSRIKSKNLIRLEETQKSPLKQFYEGNFSTISIYNKKTEINSKLDLNKRNWKTTGNTLYRIRNRAAKSEIYFGY